MTPLAAPSADRADAGLAAALFAIDPVGLGGIAVRAPYGPAREWFVRRLLSLLPEGAPVRRLPAGVDDDRLLGGLDLTASLAAGRPLAARGLLCEADGGVLVVPMAERLEPALAGRLAAALDLGECVLARDGLSLRRPARFGIILLDEGASPEERPPGALLDRAAFVVEAAALEAEARAPAAADADAVAAARERLCAVTAPDALIGALCDAAVRLGLLSLRAPVFALRAARAHAALHGRSAVEPEDAAAAARLVLAAHAGVELSAAEPQEAPPEPPSEPPSEPPPEPPPEPPDDCVEADPPAGAADAPPPAGPPPDPAEPDPAPETLDNLLVAAVQAQIPAGILDGEGGLRPARGGGRGRGGGRLELSKTRGRPAGSRPGALGRGARLDLVATLKAAAPLQKLRGGAPGGALRIGKEDFRIRRFAAKPETTTIFAVDASGSSALQRLGEVKGAVERLLADAYVSRARVALVTFRDQGSDLLLAPTRSLTRAKRRLSELPGGGGTPLGAGIAAALEVALDERSRARRPMIVVLTDGRANVSRSGAPGRAAAEADALAAAREVKASAVSAVYIDTAPRPGPDAERFARAMGARYAPLPFASAEQLSRAVAAFRADGG